MTLQRLLVALSLFSKYERCSVMAGPSSIMILVKDQRGITPKHEKELVKLGWEKAGDTWTAQVDRKELEIKYQ